MTIGEAIRKYRTEAGITQSRLADLMPGWHQQTVLKIEKDKRVLRFDEAAALASILRFDLGDLAALVPTPEECATCWGKPPPGFRCNACGRSA